MRTARIPVRLLLVGFLLVASLNWMAISAVADHDEEDDEDDDPTIEINFDVDEVVDAIRRLADQLTDFTGSFSAVVTEILFQTFYQPFINLLRTTAAVVLGMMIWLPDTTIPEVLEIHWLAYQAALLIGSAGFTVIGIVYMGYDPFGIPYHQIKPLIPRLLAALIFGAIAPWLLQYPVELAEVTAQALAPADMSFTGLLMLSGELILISVVQAFILLAVLIIFAVQKIYILFAVAASPLIAVMWALPYTRRYASPLIGAFYGFLLISWLDVIVFRLTVALLSVSSFDFASWIVGLGGVFLLLGVPYIVLTAGMSAAGPALAFASGAARSAAAQRKASQRETVGDPFPLEDPDHGTGNRFRENSEVWGDSR